MKLKAIQFFSPKENSEKVEKSVEQPKPTGYISASGKLVLPLKSIELLGIDEATSFKIGSEKGKRKLKSLYLVPASSEDSEAFELVKSGRGFVIPLGVILKRVGVDFGSNKYTFSISAFDYEDGVAGYELELNDSVAKPEPTGKKRGPKPKGTVVAQ